MSNKRQKIIDKETEKKKRKVRLQCPPTTTYKTKEDLQQFIVEDVQEAMKKISHQEIILVPFGVSTKLEIEAIKEDAKIMFKWYNDSTKKESNVPQPTVEMLLEPKKHRKQWEPFVGKTRHEGKTKRFSVPNMQGGMVNLYNSHISQVLINNPVVSELFNVITGTSKWQVHPNRMRLVCVPKTRDNINQLHWETKGNKIGVIFTVSEERSFVWWEGTSDMESEEHRAYIEAKGNSSFIQIPDEDAHNLAIFKGKRRRIIIPQGYILIWNHFIAHEVCEHVASLSIFLSPFNPEESEFFDNVKNQPSNPFYFPSQYIGLTPRQTEIAGLFFGIAGSFWPSTKEVFQLWHQQAMNNAVLHALPRLLRPNRNGDEGRNVQYMLPTTGEFKPTREELEGMDNIPDFIFSESAPNATVDVFKRYSTCPMTQYRLGLRKTIPLKKNFN